MERVPAQDRPATVERAAAVCSLARCVTRGRIFKMFWLSTPDLPATLRMLVARPLTPPARLSLSVLFRVISSCCALCFVSGGSGCLFALSVRALLPSLLAHVLVPNCDNLEESGRDFYCMFAYGCAAAPVLFGCHDIPT